MTEKHSGERLNDPESLVFKRPPQHYYVWQEQQGIPIHKTFYVEDLATVEVARRLRLHASRSAHHHRAMAAALL